MLQSSVSLSAGQRMCISCRRSSTPGDVTMVYRAQQRHARRTRTDLFHASKCEAFHLYTGGETINVWMTHPLNTHYSSPTTVNASTHAYKGRNYANI